MILPEPQARFRKISCGRGSVNRQMALATVALSAPSKLHTRQERVESGRGDRRCNFESEH
jgi:hypothetical protein